jgi:hypothetical protein
LAEERLADGAMAMAAETVPLGVLLRREVTSERMERPDVLCGEAARSRKGEDLTLLRAQAGHRVAGDPSTSFSVFAVLHCPPCPPPSPPSTHVQNVLESPARNCAPAARGETWRPLFSGHYLEATPVVLCMIHARPARFSLLRLVQLLCCLRIIFLRIYY